MKQLRRTIRRILLENNDFYEKIAVLLCTGDLESINQAIELAETMGYIHRVEYELSEPNQGTAYHYLVHQWTFSAVKPFEAIIREEWGKRTSYNPDFVIYPKRNHSIGIKLVKPEEQ